MKPFILLPIFLIITSCATQGKLHYISANGEYKTACETEYTWLPSVDKYAVEYILSHCAKKAVKQGNKVLDESLLSKDLTIPKPPKGKNWSAEYAKKLYKQHKLTDKEYGYIIAFIDLGLNKP